MRTPPFRLYPEEQHWWSFNDYGTVLEVTRRLQAKTVLEFGPGWSTRALIEGGATTIDSCEDNPAWFKVHAERLVPKFPDIVTLHPYTCSDSIFVPGVVDQRIYDMGLIDGPFGTLERPAVLRYCLGKCAAVLIPTEEIAYGTGALRPHIEQIAHDFRFAIEWMETGPLSGGFALLTPSNDAPTVDHPDPEVEHPDPQPENAEADMEVTPREPVPPRRSRRSRRKGAAQ